MPVLKALFKNSSCFFPSLFQCSSSVNKVVEIPSASTHIDIQIIFVIIQFIWCFAIFFSLLFSDLMLLFLGMFPVTLAVSFVCGLISDTQRLHSQRHAFTVSRFTLPPLVWMLLYLIFYIFDFTTRSLSTNYQGEIKRDFS